MDISSIYLHNSLLQRITILNHDIRACVFVGFFAWSKIQCHFRRVSFPCYNWMLTPCVTPGSGKKNVWRTRNIKQLRNFLKKVMLNLKRVSKYQAFSSKSFLSMYCVHYFYVMLLYAVNNISRSNHGEFQMPFAVTFTSVNDASTFSSIVSVGFFL